MQVKHDFLIKAPIQEVWQFMLDPQKLGSCIPGCETIEVLGNNTYKSKIRIKLPIFSITAESTTTVTEVDPPHHLRSVTEGQYDLGGGKFRQEMVVDLKEGADDTVEVFYSADTKLEGGFAGFSEKIIGEMAQGFAQQFAENVRSRLEKKKGT